MSEANNGMPFILYYKQIESIKSTNTSMTSPSNSKISTNNQPTDTNENSGDVNTCANNKPTDTNEILSDAHPLKTGTVIEKDGFLYLEREDRDGKIFYEEIPLYQDAQRLIDLIANSVQHWSATKETSILQSVPNNINKQPQTFAKLYDVK